MVKSVGAQFHQEEGEWQSFKVNQDETRKMRKIACVIALLVISVSLLKERLELRSELGIVLRAGCESHYRFCLRILTKHFRIEPRTGSRKAE